MVKVLSISSSDERFNIKLFPLLLVMHVFINKAQVRSRSPVLLPECGEIKAMMRTPARGIARSHTRISGTTFPLATSHVITFAWRGYFGAGGLVLLLPLLDRRKPISLKHLLNHRLHQKIPQPEVNSLDI